VPFGDQPAEEEIKLLYKGLRSTTLSVAASDTQDTSGCDYICDGTNDQVEINQAIAALPAGGGLIHLLEGTYNVSAPITIDKDNVAIIGTGANTVLRIRDNHNANLNVIETTNHSNILIKDLRVDGNQANQIAGLMFGIHFNTVTYSRVEGCWLEDINRRGISLDSSNYNTVTGNTCQGNGWYGIYLTASNDNTITSNNSQGDGYGIYLIGSTNNTVDGNTIQGSGLENIYLHNSSNDNTITGNICNGGSRNGIWLDGGSNNNTISGNTCEGHNANGIYVYGDYNNTVTGNTCYNNLNEGIWVRGSDYNTVVGNTFLSNGNDGIGISEASSYNTIAGNTCQDNGDSAIWIGGGSNNNTIAGNTGYGNGQHGIYLDGSDNNTVESNTLTNNGLDADVTYDGIHLSVSDYNNIQGNTIRTTVAAPPPNRQRYGINISNAACNGNLVANNDLYQSGQTGLYNDAGTDTRGTVTGEISPTGNTLVVAASNSLDPVRADFYCDNVSDETEINAAITALGAIGGTVKLLEGTFTVDGAITLANSVALVGQGAGTIITIPDGHDAGINIIYGTSISRVLIKDLMVDGNRANQTAGVMYGIYFDTVTYSRIEGCWVEDMYGGDGIHMMDVSDHNIISNNTIGGNAAIGLSIMTGHNNAIMGNTVEGNGDDGICFGTASTDNIVASNTVIDNTQYGICVEDSDYNVLEANTAQGNSFSGIFLHTADYNTADGNLVSANQQHGIYVWTGDHNTILGNTVINNGLNADVTFDGINIRTDSNHNNVQDNTIRTTVAPNRQRYGINIVDAASDGNIVKDNDLYQSGQTGLFNDAGTGTRLAELFVNSIFDDTDANVTMVRRGTKIALAMDDAQDTHICFNFRVPSDFHELVRARIVVVPTGDGDLYWGVATDWGLCQELFAAGGGAIALHAETVVGDELECLDIDAALVGITAGDHVGVNFQRDATNILDTIDDPVELIQFWMQYV